MVIVAAKVIQLFLGYFPVRDDGRYVSGYKQVMERFFFKF